MGKCVQNVGSKTQREKTLARPKLRWQNITEKDLMEIGCESADWICLAQDRVQLQVLLNMVMNL